MQLSEGAWFGLYVSVGLIITIISKFTYKEMWDRIWLHTNPYTEILAFLAILFIWPLTIYGNLKKYIQKAIAKAK